MKRYLKVIWLGLLVWLIPFLASFGFYNATGNLVTSYDFFKSCMIVISTFIACISVYWYFRNKGAASIATAFWVGVAWLGINVLLDLVILVPFAKMTYLSYFESIGLRYLQIPMIVVLPTTLLSIRPKN
jgi:hypothetical protein